MSADHEKPYSIETAAIEAAVAGVMGKTQEELVYQLDVDSQPLITAGIRHAREVREADMDPGDAYLEGLTHGRVASQQIELARKALRHFDPDIEMGELAAPPSVKDDDQP